MENLEKMRKGTPHTQLEEVELMIFIDFPGTEEIFLEKNYRSTGSILRSSLAIVAEGGISLSPLINY